MPAGDVLRERDGRLWRIGAETDIAWIAGGTESGLTIGSAIPPVFEAYGTVVVPTEYDERDEQDRLLLRLLSKLSGDQPWWLGYLDTGGDDVVFPDAPRVSCYAHWGYVLVQAGPEQAANWRDASESWSRGALPDIIFPNDRSWLVSRLWDDDWRCFGGSMVVVDLLIAERLFETRRVGLEEDATPPGHVAR